MIPETLLPWGYLVVSILSVNNYLLERAYGLLERLEKEGLLDPARLGQWDIGEVVGRLDRAGYGRGPGITKIVAERMVALGVWASKREFEKCTRDLVTMPDDEVGELLLSVKGVGPMVLRNFLLLRS